MKPGAGDLQPSRPATEQAQGGAHVVDQPEYLLVSEVVTLLRFDKTAPSAPYIACWQFLKRHAVPMKRRGRTLLIERRVLEATLREV